MEIELYVQRNLLNLITHHYPQIISLISHQVDLQIWGYYLQWPQESLKYH